MTGRFLVTMLLATAGVAPGVLADEAAAKQIEPFVRTIATAQEVNTAAKAYARGCAVDRSHPAIHDVYMQRMLQFGQPQLAKYPARALIGIDPGNGMAWGVLSYNHARRGELMDALVTTLRAVEADPKNPSHLHNAGQLIAWYENELEAPALPNALRRAMARVKDRHDEDKTFALAYRRIDRGFEALDEKDRELGKRIAASQSEVAALTQQALLLDQQARTVDREIARRREELTSLHRQYHTAYLLPSVVEDDRTLIVNPYTAVYSRYPYLYQDAIYGQMRLVEREIDSLQGEQTVLNARGRQVLRQVRQRREELDELRHRLDLAGRKLAREFRWDPPAVNGRVYDEQPALPAGTAKDVPEVARDAESEADRQLQLARLYVANDLTDKAISKLKSLLDEYPKTKAAQPARELLAKLSPAG